ncbi:dynein axonemal assembly factor 10 [Condylostylus longicornis]|uniref:dynein axonemal assembly factor 10 n=1 Tax=Condylostylus longicornis TaxID=2530218 RepID=UPI00244E45AC|nr:dynein axonemal assembly factor 10 [Condylostylus longicornis]
MDKPRMIEYISKNLDYTVFDVKWIPCSAKFIVVGVRPKGSGIIQIYELNGADVDLIKTIEKKNALKCSTFGASTLRHRHLAVGDYAGRMMIIDLERPDLAVYNVEAHKQIINSIDGIGGAQLNCGAPEIVTGGKDGVVKVWDPRQGSDPVVNIEPESSDAQSCRDCWTVAFGDSHSNEERKVAAGYDNGDLKMFDLRNLDVYWETSLKNGICSIEFDRKDIKMNKFGVTTLEGGLYVYDLRTFHKEKGFAYVQEKNAGRSVGTNGVISGPKSTVWCIKHCPQNRDIFVTGGGTGSVRLWQYQYPEKRRQENSSSGDVGVAGTIKMLHASTLSTQPVHCFDWSPDKLGLAVAGSLDQAFRVILTTKLNCY